MSNSEKEIWTIGHSTHPLEEFLDLLENFGIEAVADIRSFPGSRKFPQFNKENLHKSLADAGIEYRHILNLGGRRKVNKDSTNTIWKNESFRAYADYMQTGSFEKGLSELTELALNKRTAYMCSEAVWWRCHRSMVSDILKARGWTVWHIMSLNHQTEHPYTKPAHLIDGELVYGKEE